MENVFVSKHPLVQHKLSILRNRETPAKEVRELFYELSQLVLYDATSNLPLEPTAEMQSPFAPYAGQRLAVRVGFVPILRSGLALLDGALELIPTARVHHLGIFREATSLQPVEYYNKLPEVPNCDMAIVLDPMVATGRTATAAINMLKDSGLKDIKFVCICASQAGLTQLTTAHPGVKVYTAAIDSIMNDRGFIIPGLGDSGDRLYNTPRDHTTA